MDPLTLALLGGGLVGGLKGALIDGPQMARQNKVNAEVNRYSPWTHMQAPTKNENPNILGDTINGGLAGGMAAQGGLFDGLSSGAEVELPGASPLSAPDVWGRLSKPGMLGVNGIGASNSYGMRGLSLLGGR